MTKRQHHERMGITMNCIKCGNQLNEGDTFCVKCGKRVNSESGKHLNFTGIYTHIMTIAYGLAILTCFICNLAVGRTLSWFYIVLVGISIAYSITNVPFMVKRHRLVTSAACVSVMVYVLLAVCNWFVNGNWLFSVAYPIATVSLIYAWAILLVCCSRRMNWMLKSAFISLLVGITTITVNSLCNYLLGNTARLYDYLNPVYWPVAIIGNKITFVCCVCYFIFALIGGIRVKYSKAA